MKGVTDYIWTF